MHEHPEGPSATSSICPRNIPIAKFYGNSAHSFGWFGLWFFPTYHPKVGGACGESTPQPALVENFFSWNNEKGIEVRPHTIRKLVLRLVWACLIDPFHCHVSKTKTYKHIPHQFLNYSAMQCKKSLHHLFMEREKGKNEHLPWPENQCFRFAWWWLI